MQHMGPEVSFLPSLKVTFSHLPIDGWKTIPSLRDAMFWGANCQFQGGSPLGTPHRIWTKHRDTKRQNANFGKDFSHDLVELIPQRASSELWNPWTQGTSPWKLTYPIISPGFFLWLEDVGRWNLLLKCSLFRGHDNFLQNFVYFCWMILPQRKDGVSNWIHLPEYFNSDVKNTWYLKNLLPRAST